MKKQRNEKPIDEELLMRMMADVCEKLGISKRTLQTYRDRGLLPYSQINHKIYYRTEDVEAFVEAMSREMTEDE